MLGPIILILGVLSRFIFHLPNFTPVLALALFSGIYVNRKYAVLLPLVLMMVSDVFLGLHNVMPFTWLSVLLIAFMGTALRRKKTPLRIFGSSAGAAVLFFIITNFGVWLMGWYTYSWEGLARCYVAAIPFFRSTLLSTVGYSFVFLGIYELVAFRVRGTRLAPVLLDS